jgi:hypothetical protein
MGVVLFFCQRSEIWQDLKVQKILQKENQEINLDLAKKK